MDTIVYDLFIDDQTLNITDGDIFSDEEHFSPPANFVQQVMHKIVQLPRPAPQPYPWSHLDLLTIDLDPLSVR